jgi:glucose-6-phosphate dehydrogenase assembly protein OpcA
VEAAVTSLPLEAVEREVARLWEEEARRSQASRVELATLVALVSEPGLLDRAKDAVERLTRVYPLRTILAVWEPGEPPSLTADVALHRLPSNGQACGDSITVRAVGQAREWLPENIERLVLADLPICAWWVGDLPDFDDLFDRVVVRSDLVVVNSSEMDLRDLEKLSSIAARCRDRYALADLAWIRLRWIQEIVARFFDDPVACTTLSGVRRIAIEFSPREGEQDVTSTTAGLLFGWIAHVLRLGSEAPQWKRGETWGEVTLGAVQGRFERRRRNDVRPGAVLRLTIECEAGRFDLERQEDPNLFLWTREVPGVPTPSQVLRVSSHEEWSLLARCMERPRRDMLLEASLLAGSRVVRPVAPRLSMTPPARPT